jgi:hypothetical protein
MAAGQLLHGVPSGRHEQGSSFFRRTTSNLSFHRVPFLEIGIGGTIPCNCVIELQGHPGTGKSFSLSEIAVEALVSSGCTDSSVAPRTVLWFDTELKFNPNCIMKCAEKAAAAPGCTVSLEELLGRIIVFKPSDLLQMVATLQGMRLGAACDSFSKIGVPIVVIVDGISPLFSTSRSAGDAPNLFDQASTLLTTVQPNGYQSSPSYFCTQLILELGAISGRGRGDMPKFQCCVFVSSVPAAHFPSFHANSEQVCIPGYFIYLYISPFLNSDTRPEFF